MRKQYYEAPFVEFLEFFARLAMLKFKAMNGTLGEKIMALMDLAFPIVNCKRKEVLIEIEYVS
jgi:hypothetical protein